MRNDPCRTPVSYALIAMLALFCWRTAEGQEFDPTSHVLKSAFAPAVDLTDRNGDGTVNDADWGLWIITEMLSPRLTDIDGSGIVDQSEGVAILSVILRGLAGDLDGDHAVDESDLSEAVNNLGTANPQPSEGDINADACIDGLDIALVAAQMGSPLELDPDVVAARLMAFADGSTGSIPPAPTPCTPPAPALIYGCECPVTFVEGFLLIDCSCADILPIWMIPDDETVPAWTQPYCNISFESDGFIAGGQLWKIWDGTCVILTCCQDPDGTTRWNWHACCRVYHKLMGRCSPFVVPFGEFLNEPSPGQGPALPPMSIQPEP